MLERVIHDDEKGLSEGACVCMCILPHFIFNVLVCLYVSVFYALVTLFSVKLCVLLCKSHRKVLKCCQ